MTKPEINKEMKSPRQKRRMHAAIRGRELKKYIKVLRQSAKSSTGEK